MSFFDRLFGREPDRPARAPGSGQGAPGPGRGAPGSGRGGPVNDEQALERYRYMLRTAPPEDIERAHEEAFAALSPEQRRAVLQQLGREAPPGELPDSDDPRSLARLATRAEIRRPGTMERAFSPAAMGLGMPGLGSMFLYGLAGSFIGSAVAQSFFDNDPGYAAGGQAADAQGFEGGRVEDQGDAQGAEYGEAGYAEGEGEDLSADAGGGSADAGGSGDFGGGDVGGGDFGGGDFGGGDF
jgi:hypothetical protein